MIDFDHWIKRVEAELEESLKQRKTWARTVERARGGISVLKVLQADTQTNLAAAEAVSRICDPPAKKKLTLA